MANYCRQYNRFCEFATEYGYCMVTVCKKFCDKAIPSNGTIYVPFSKLKEYVADERPMVEAEPVRHGRWIFNPKDAIEMMFTLPKCSECGASSADGGNYCPNCGAKMDKEKENGIDQYRRTEKMARWV